MLTHGALIFLVLSTISKIVLGDWGDYADSSFECPANITCAPVCVATAEDCPIDLKCESGFTLCADGSCATNCNEDLTSPCGGNTCGMKVTCARTVLPQPDCSLFYGDWYANATASDTCDGGGGVELLSFAGPVFVTIYAYFSFMCFLIVAYPAFNQRCFPVGETLPLDDFSKESLLTGIPAAHKGWTQTSVRKTPLGTLLFYLTTLTLWFIQCLLLILVAFYYKLGSPKNPFQDEVQVLKAFEIVWMVGLVFTLCLKWPPTIESLFLRRCVSADATTVAVFAPSTAPELHEITGNPGVVMIKRVMTFISNSITMTLSCIFSDTTRQKHIRGKVEYCPVFIELDGTRSFFFRLRRYVYNDEVGRFVPGILEVGSTLGDFQNCSGGLSAAKVAHRRSKIGTNSVNLKKPNLLFGVIEEFSKMFYIYQNFMIWVCLHFLSTHRLMRVLLLLYSQICESIA